MLRRLLGWFAAFAVLCFLLPFRAGAVDFGVEAGGLDLSLVNVESDMSVVDFADYVCSGLIWANNSLRNTLNKDVCPYAPTLNGGHKFELVRTMKNGQVGLFYQCTQCGKAYGDMLTEAYDQYVKELPGQVVNSDGSFLWTPDFDNMSSIGYFYGVGGSFAANRLTFNDSSNGASGVCHPHDSIVLYVNRPDVYVYFSTMYITVPWDGQYTLVSNFRSYPVVYSGIAGSRFAIGNSDSMISPCTFTIEWPVFSVAPSASFASFFADTRVGGDVSGAGTGLYGYVQDGTLYQSTVETIYSETSNVYQNPVTGDTSNVTNWSYDYSDRSYVLTTEEGDTVTLTYGDSNLTINEGGTTYNLYYLMEEPEGVREEPVHIHSYSSSVTTEATCTASGVKTYVCSDCNDTYTETIPALGHDYSSAVTMQPTCTATGVRMFTCSRCGDVYTASVPAVGHTWSVVQSVPTAYDESGNLVTEGYTLYQCSTCGEQYKISSASGGDTLPLPASGGASSGGTDLVEVDSSVGRGFLSVIAHGLTEDLPVVLRTASSWFVEFPAFYAGFVSFLKDGIAGCLPDVSRQMMSFGLGMVTFVGIVRKIIGR